MNAIITKYNPTVITDTPRYTWFVNDASGNAIFYCDYKDTRLVIRMTNFMGAIVFNKLIPDTKIEESITFCLSYLASYNNLQ